MLEEDLELGVKVVVVGNGSVGKSSLIQRYCKGIFTSEYKKTIGVDFLEKEIEIDDEVVRLMLWDTAGQEEYESITRAYFRGAQMCVLVFSTVDSKSFEAIESWKAKVEDECESNVLTVLVQNKIDLLDEAAYSHEEVEELVHKLNVKLFRTSVKENFNVDPIFDYLAKTFLSQRKQTIKEINSNGNNLIANAFRSVDTNNEIEVNKSTPNGPSSSLTNNAGKTSFRIKPNKQRTNKRFRFCLLL